MMGADLAERLRRAGLEAAGQRRHVTVLFADISGFTALSERIDSEDLYNLVQDYIRLLANNVYKYEGVVDKITGDGIMALFGAPISHENNSERAVRAALDMQSDLEELSQKTARELGAEIRVRIGLHSGLVIVGGIGANDLVLNYTAIGDTVNLAHRIEEAAPPGSILISEAVFRQVRPFFECRRVAALNPKGITHPVIAYEVIGEKSQPERARGIEGLRAPMIGREGELTQLKRAAQDLLENRRGQFVLITGEAGLGKSRLADEFKAWLDISQLRILEGQSLAYRRVSYWLIRHILYHYLEMPLTAPPLKARERLHQRLFQTMGIQAEEALPYLELLMSLPLSDSQAAQRLELIEAGQLRQQIFLTMYDLLVLEARKQPLLIILEDLHWADEASLEMLAFLLDALRQAPIFFLAVSRSVQSGALERAVIWARQNLGERFRHIQLQSLSRDQSRQLLNLLLSIPNLPAPLREQILLRAAGVPFYLEETLRMLIDQGVLQKVNGRWQIAATVQPASLGVPDTLQELILTRFDRLTPVQRRTLQVAAVIGKDFSLPLLSSVLSPEELYDLPSTLESLVEREFILPLHSGASNTEFTFRHILMSDAIYSTLLRKERSALHSRVAETIEQLYADRIEDQVELLANHFRWSTRLDRALHYLILAGQKAFRNHVNQQARMHYEAALDLLKQVEFEPYQAYQIHVGLGDCLMFSGEYPEARKHYELALREIQQEPLGEKARERSSVLRKIARTHERQGDYEIALQRLSEAQEALEATGQLYVNEQARIWNDRAWIYFRRGELTEAERLLREALSQVEDSTDYDVIASIYNRLGGIAYNQGDWEQAANALRKSIQIREETHDLVNLATLLNNLGLLEIEMGQLDSALENLARSYELKKRLNQPEGVAMALNNLGWLRIQRGELGEARSALQQALDLARQIGYSSLCQQILRNFGELHLAAQDWSAALAALDENRRALEELGAEDQLIESYCYLGEASLGLGNIEEARMWAGKAKELLERCESRPGARLALQRGEYLRFRGMLAMACKDWTQAQEYLDEGEAIFQELHSQLLLARLLFQKGELAKMQANYETARAHYSRAVQIFKDVGALLDAKRTREAYNSLSIS